MAVDAEHPLVLVLGAGASVHCGFPTGAQLIEQIKSELTYWNAFGGWNFSVADAHRLRRFRRLLIEQSPQSIDQFLHINRHDEDIVRNGKDIIATLILGRQSGDVFSSDNWYQHIAAYIFSDVNFTFDDVLRRINCLRIITFNYDVSVEYFVSRSVSTLPFDMEAKKALIEAFSRNIIHVHGTFYNYGAPPEYIKHFFDSPYMRFQIVRRYSLAQNEKLYKYASSYGQNVKIIGDERDDNDRIDVMRSWITSSGALFLLGYGFHNFNNEILSLGMASRENRFIFATNFGGGIRVDEKIHRLYGNFLNEKSHTPGALGRDGTVFVSKNTVNDAMRFEYSMADIEF